MTGQVRSPAVAGKGVSRRSFLVGSALTALGIGVGAGVAACSGAAAPGPQGSEPRSGERLGAMVGLPIDEADVDRWRADVDILQEHGQNLVRTGIYAWMVAPKVETWSPNKAEFFRVQLDYARERGLAVNMVVPGAPDWAQGFEFDEYRAACTWFWTQMQDSFGDQVDLWQAYNEADHAHYQEFTPATRDETYLGEFAQMLGIAREILGRDGVPVTTNLTGWPLNDDREQEWYLVLDAIEDQLDLISIDLYPADDEDEIALLGERMDRVRERYGKPIFVAEIGLQTTPGSWTEPEQQQHVTAAIEQLRTVELWGIALYTLRDHEEQAAFGIVNSDGSKKLGFDDVMLALSPR